MKTVPLWLTIALLSLWCTASAVAQHGSVAKLGSPPQIEIRGAETFRTDEIRERLFTDLAAVNEISVTGNKKNSAEDVLAFLGLQTGMPFRGELDKVAQRKL